MRYLEPFNEGLFTKYRIRKLCEKYHIKNYTINKDGSIDVDGDVAFLNQGLFKLPIRFNRVSGLFSCIKNNLTSLDGCPDYVGGDFNCGYNRITSLKGGPREVVGHFGCSTNKLTSLEGSPDYIGGDYYSSNNEITSLEGFPKSVGKYFYCICNPVEDVWKLFEDKTKVELFNDYDIIRDGNVIILDRLISFLREIGKPIDTFNNDLFSMHPEIYLKSKLKGVYECI